jgi:hypothetical protein
MTQNLALPKQQLEAAMHARLMPWKLTALSASSFTAGYHE